MEPLLGWVLLLAMSSAGIVHWCARFVRILDTPPPEPVPAKKKKKPKTQPLTTDTAPLEAPDGQDGDPRAAQTGPLEAPEPIAAEAAALEEATESAGRPEDLGELRSLLSQDLPTDESVALDAEALPETLLETAPQSPPERPSLLDELVALESPPSPELSSIEDIEAFVLSNVPEGNLGAAIADRVKQEPKASATGPLDQKEIDALIAQMGDGSTGTMEPLSAGPLDQSAIDALITGIGQETSTQTPDGPLDQAAIDALIAGVPREAAIEEKAPEGPLDQAEIDALIAGVSQEAAVEDKVPEGPLDQAAIDALIAGVSQEAVVEDKPPEGPLDQAAIDALIAGVSQEAVVEDKVPEGPLDQAAIDALIAGIAPPAEDVVEKPDVGGESEGEGVEFDAPMRGLNSDESAEDLAVGARRVEEAEAGSDLSEVRYVGPEPDRDRSEVRRVEDEPEDLAGFTEVRISAAESDTASDFSEIRTVAPEPDRDRNEIRTVAPEPERDRDEIRTIAAESDADLPDAPVVVSKASDLEAEGASFYDVIGDAIDEVILAVAPRRKPRTSTKKAETPKEKKAPAKKKPKADPVAKSAGKAKIEPAPRPKVLDLAKVQDGMAASDVLFAYGLPDKQLAPRGKKAKWVYQGTFEIQGVRRTGRLTLEMGEEAVVRYHFEPDPD